LTELFGLPNARGSEVSKIVQRFTTLRSARGRNQIEEAELKNLRERLSALSFGFDPVDAVVDPIVDHAIDQSLNAYDELDVTAKQEVQERLKKFFAAREPRGGRDKDHSV
jgi:hypothetical protein